MKTVLMIAPYFIPRRRVGALRPFKFVIHLKKFGYEPVVLTIGAPGSNKTTIEKELLDGITVIETSTPFDQTGASEKKSETTGFTKNFSKAVLNWIDKQTPLDTWIYLFKAKYRSIYTEIKKIDPDIVWATGDPWSGLWLGEKISNDLNKPFIADFRDPWTLSQVNLRARSSFSSHWDQKIEKKILARADRITFTSEQARIKYTKTYSNIANKSVTIFNSFDRNLLNPNPVNKWDENLDRDKLNVIFFGRFRRLSPVKHIAKALNNLKIDTPDILKDIRIHSFGFPDSECHDNIQKLDLGKFFVSHDSVMPEYMTSVLKSADILLLSTNVERDDIIPAKLWDYLSVDVPILSIVSNPEIGEIIDKTKSGIQLHPEETGRIAELLTDFVLAKKKNGSVAFSEKSDHANREIYSSEYTTRQLASILDELTIHV